MLNVWGTLAGCTALWLEQLNDQLRDEHVKIQQPMLP